MTALLRLADGLDSGHRQHIDDLVASRAGQTIVLDLVAKDGPLAEDTQLMRKADMFQEELGHGLQITVGRAVTVPELMPGESGRMRAVEGAGGGSAGSSSAGRPIARRLA